MLQVSYCEMNIEQQCRAHDEWTAFSYSFICGCIIHTVCVLLVLVTGLGLYSASNPLKIFDMKRTEIESTGVVGINIMLNHSELVALKGFVTQLKKLEECSENKYRYNEKALPLVKSMVIFLDKMLPENVMSVDEAYEQMFTLPTDELIADNEL